LQSPNLGSDNVLVWSRLQERCGFREDGGLLLSLSMRKQTDKSMSRMSMAMARGSLVSQKTPLLIQDQQRRPCRVYQEAF
jgi:hypothetical protein